MWWAFRVTAPLWWPTSRASSKERTRERGSASDSSSTSSEPGCWRSWCRSTAPTRRTPTNGFAQEVRQYSSDLAEKNHVVVLTKRDLLPAGDPLPELHAPDAAGVLAVSSVAGSGVEELKEYLWKLVEEAKAADAGSSEDLQEAEDGSSG